MYRGRPQRFQARRFVHQDYDKGYETAADALREDMSHERPRGRGRGRKTQGAGDPTKSKEFKHTAQAEAK